MAFQSTESQERESPSLGYIRTERPCSVLSESLLPLRNDRTGSVWSGSVWFGFLSPETDSTRPVSYFINKSVLFVAYKIKSFLQFIPV